MIDLRSVQVHGAFNFGRARVLWQHGLLRIYGPNGPLVDIQSDEPTRKKGRLLAWTARTAKGVIDLRSKCVTCGGRKWWRIVWMDAEELWGMRWQK